MSSKKSNQSTGSRLFERDAKEHAKSLNRESLTRTQALKKRAKALLKHKKEHAKLVNRMQAVKSRAEVLLEQKRAQHKQHSDNRLTELAVLIDAYRHFCAPRPDNTLQLIAKAIGGDNESNLTTEDRETLRQKVATINAAGADDPLAKRRQAHIDALTNLRAEEASRLLQLCCKDRASAYILSASAATDALQTMEHTLGEFTAQNASETDANIATFAEAVTVLDHTILPEPEPATFEGVENAALEALRMDDDTAADTFCRDHPEVAQQSAARLVEQAIKQLQSSLSRGSLNEHGLPTNEIAADTTGLGLGPAPVETNLEQQLKELNVNPGIANMGRDFDTANKNLCDAHAKLKGAIEAHRHRLINPNAEVSGKELKALYKALEEYQECKSQQQKVCNKMFTQASLAEVGSLSPVKAVLLDHPNSSSNQALWQGLSEENVDHWLSANAEQASFDNVQAAGYTRDYKSFDFLGIGVGISRIWTFLTREPKGKFSSLNDVMDHQQRRKMFQEFCTSSHEAREMAAKTVGAGTSPTLGKDQYHWTVKIDTDALAVARRQYDQWKKAYKAELKEKRTADNLERASKGLPPTRHDKENEAFFKAAYKEQTGLEPPLSDKQVKELEEKMQKQFWQYCSKNMSKLQKADADLAAHSDNTNGPRAGANTGVSTEAQRQPDTTDSTGISVSGQQPDPPADDSGVAVQPSRAAQDALRERQVTTATRAQNQAAIAATPDETQTARPSS